MPSFSADTASRARSRTEGANSIDIAHRPGLFPSTRQRGTPGPLLVLAAASLWGTTGTAATFAPAAASPLSLGAATMGMGGVLTFLLAGRSALRVLRAGRAVLLWAVLSGIAVAVYPLAFYTSMAKAGVATGTVVTIGSRSQEFRDVEHTRSTRRSPTRSR